MTISFLTILFSDIFKICLRVLCHICAMTGSQKHKLRQTLWTSFTADGRNTTQSARSEKKQEKQRNKSTEQHQQKATVRATANVTSSHDWCDCIYSINVGILAHFLPSSPHPHHHYAMVSMVTAQQVSKSFKEMASTTTHHLWRCWRRSAACLH